MKRTCVGIVLVVAMLSAIWLARGAEAPATPVPGSFDVPVANRFVPVDLYLDAGAKHLGAYQVELAAKDGQIVGLEGGDSKAFEVAPYYDPAALQGNRVVVAAFSTDNALPTGETRVARLHLLVAGNGAAAHLPEMTTTLVVATDGNGEKIEAKLSLRPYQGEKP